MLLHRGPEPSVLLFGRSTFPSSLLRRLCGYREGETDNRARPVITHWGWNSLWNLLWYTLASLPVCPFIRRAPSFLSSLLKIDNFNFQSYSPAEYYGRGGPCDFLAASAVIPGEDGRRKCGCSRTFAASFFKLHFSFRYKIIPSHLVSRGQMAMGRPSKRPSRSRAQAERRDLAAETPQSVFLSTKLNFNSSVCRLIRR